MKRPWAILGVVRAGIFQQKDSEPHDWPLASAITTSPGKSKNPFLSQGECLATRNWFYQPERVKTIS